MAAINPSRESMAVAFSLLGGIGIGYMEVITVAGGILMVDAENVGVAIGIQYALRLGLSSLSSKFNKCANISSSSTNYWYSFHLRYDCKYLINHPLPESNWN
jgi:hypothetical protein